MQTLATLVITSLTVSLDSFAAGFSVSLNKRHNPSLPAVVALVTFAMCALTTLIGNALKGAAESYVDLISAVILSFLATVSLLKEEDGNWTNVKTLNLNECVAVGVAVGLDASIANLSLAVEGYGMVAPIVFAVTHYFTVLAGERIAGKIAFAHTNVLSSAVLYALAIVKLI